MVCSLYTSREKQRERAREKLSLFRWHIFATNRLLSRVSQLSPLSRRVQESTKEHLMTRLTRGFVPPTSLLFTSQLPPSSRYPLLTTEYRYSLLLFLAVRTYSQSIANFFPLSRMVGSVVERFPRYIEQEGCSGSRRSVREISVACSGH